MKWNISRKWVNYSLETNGCNNHTQPSFTYSSSKMETPKHCVKSVQKFKVNKNDNRTTSYQWHRSGVFIVNFAEISHVVMVLLLLTLNN